MRDLFGDPILLIPVIIILTIFGVGYVGFMIWAYNRDAKKQGKQSGCLPVILVFIFIMIAGCRAGTTSSFYASYEQIWNASQASIPTYTQPNVSDNERGVIEYEVSEWGRVCRTKIKIEPIDPPKTLLQRNVRVKCNERIGITIPWAPSPKSRLILYENQKLQEIENYLNASKN